MIPAEGIVSSMISRTKQAAIQSMVPATVFLLGFAGASAVPAQTEQAATERPFLHSIRVGGSYTRWSIAGLDSTVTVGQSTLPVEIQILPDPHLRVRAGLELRSQSLAGEETISSTGLAGGWLDARCLLGSRLLVGAGVAAPFRTPSLTVREARTVSWLEETGLQMPGANLALEPSVEARLSRSVRVSEGCSAAGGLAMMMRLPHAAYRGGSSFDPGDRLRIALAIEGPLVGCRGALSAAGTAETVSRVSGADRYQEGPRLQTEVLLVRPGNRQWSAEFGAYLQAEGEGMRGWTPPRGGSLLRAGVSLSGGTTWRWAIGVEAWKSRGFDDLLGSLTAVRPKIGLERAAGAHRLGITAAPAFGSASDDRSLRGFDMSIIWEFAQ